MTTAHEAVTDVRLLVDVVNGMDVDALGALPLDDALTAWAALEDAYRTLGQVRAAVTHLIAEAMKAADVKQHTVDHLGTVIRHGKRNRTKWDTDDLRRAVLDSRLVDSHTGEVLDPNPVDKILHVWNLGAPRVTALRERGIDPDEYCHSEFGGWSLELQS